MFNQCLMVFSNSTQHFYFLVAGNLRKRFLRRRAVAERQALSKFHSLTFHSFDFEPGLPLLILVIDIDMPVLFATMLICKLVATLQQSGLP